MHVASRTHGNNTVHKKATEVAVLPGIFEKEVWIFVVGCIIIECFTVAAECFAIGTLWKVAVALDTYFGRGLIWTSTFHVHNLSNTQCSTIILIIVGIIFLIQGKSCKRNLYFYPNFQVVVCHHFKIWDLILGNLCIAV